MAGCTSFKIMNLNPYEPTNSSSRTPKTRGSRWLLWAGGGCLALAALCLIVTAAGKMQTFEANATSSSTSEPANLANDLSAAIIPSLIAVPLGLLGIVLLILGWVRSRGAPRS